MAIAPDTLTFTILGETAQLAAEVRDQNGQVMGVIVTWRSRDSAIAAMNSAGLVRAVGNGMTMVVAETRGVSDSVAIAVDAPSFTLSGTVSDSRRPGMVLPGVVVWLQSWGRTFTTTGPDGRYHFPNVGGAGAVTAEAAFSYVGQTVEVNAVADLTLDFELEHTGIPPFSLVNGKWNSGSIRSSPT